VVSKLRRSEIPWQLTEEEQSEKRLEWTMKSIKSITGVLKKYKETNNI